MFYSGHKKGHGLNFMGVVMTNGLLPFMSYAALGKDHDSRALTESGFNQKMRDLDRVTLRQAPPKKYVVYADPAFPLGPHVQKGFQGILTPMQAQFNKQCNSNRVSVEWGYGYVLCHNMLRLECVSEGPPGADEPSERPLACSMHPQQLQGLL